jgi:hypothetical protein
VEEAVQKAASSVGPLLIALGVLAGVLVGLALFLRLRVAHERGALGMLGKRRAKPAAGAPGAATPGQTVGVLGRLFQVESRAELELERGPGVLLGLVDARGEARLLLDEGGRRVVRFASREPGPAGPDWPESLARAGAKCVLQAGPAPAGGDRRVALYASRDELYLMLEADGPERGLWIGRAVPVEGVELVEQSV